MRARRRLSRSGNEDDGRAVVLETSKLGEFGRREKDAVEVDWSFILREGVDDG